MPAEELANRTIADQALMLFERLARTSAGAQSAAFEGQAEQPVLRNLVAAMEKDLAEPFKSDYRELGQSQGVGGGTKFSNPANRSQIMIYERGTGLASDGVHGGPYLRLSSGRGAIERIPLMGNPILAVP